MLSTPKNQDFAMVNEISYILYKKGEAVVVPRKEWERDWLRWYQKTSGSQKRSESEQSSKR